MLKSTAGGFFFAPPDKEMRRLLYVVAGEMASAIRCNLPAFAFGNNFNPMRAVHDP